MMLAVFISIATIVSTPANATGAVSVGVPAAQEDNIFCLLQLNPDPWILKLYALRGEPAVMVESGSKKADGPLEYVAHGLPKNAKFRVAGDHEVFRHYSPKANLNAIVSASELVAGNLPYVTKSRGSLVTYVDLTGIFLTTPDFLANQVGVPREVGNSFVDLTLPKGTVVIEIEPGIILVPGYPKLPAWLARYATMFLSGSEDIPPYVLPALENLKDRDVLGKEPRKIKIHLLRAN